MSLTVEVPEAVTRVAKKLAEQEGRSLPSGVHFEMSDHDITSLLDRGILRRGGSGYGGGLEVDAEVAQALGITEFDDS
jgi:hypothetical protein